MKMRSSLFLLVGILLVSFISGCTTPLSQADANDLLPFPDTEWMMSQDQLVEALSLEEVQYETESLSVKVPGMECFGAKTEVAHFRFGGDFLGLNMVLLCYPDETDMDVVKQELVNLYGDPSNEHLLWALGDYGYLESDDGNAKPVDRRGVTFRQVLTSEHSVYWDSPVTMGDYLAENGLAFEPGDKLTPRTSRIFLENAPVSFALWTDDHGEEFYTAAMGEQYKNMVLICIQLPVSYVKETNAK